ncbi:hypothetical protein ACLBOM_14315 [Escherichia coli]
MRSCVQAVIVRAPVVAGEAETRCVALLSGMVRHRLPDWRFAVKCESPRSWLSLPQATFASRIHNLYVLFHHRDATAISVSPRRSSHRG